VAIGRESGSLAQVNAATLKIVHTWYGHFNNVNGIAFSPDGQTLVSSSLDGGVILWPLASFAAQQQRRAD
jgi:WD40 repeat protein